MLTNKTDLNQAKSSFEMYAHGFSIFLVAYLGCQVLSTRQMSLSNKHLKMGAVPFPPYLVRKKEKNGLESYSGILWDFVEYVRKARNCTFTVVIPPDGLWGTCARKNNCTGMIGLVNRSEVDFAIGIVNEAKEMVCAQFLHI